MKEFIKLYETFWRGTLAKEGLHTRVLFLAMIQLADNEGILKESPANLADYAGMSVEEAEDALLVLQKPDPSSRTPDQDGRRVLDLGKNHWAVVNYSLYIKPANDRSEYFRNYKQKQRSKVEVNSECGIPPDKIREEKKRIDKRKPPKSPLKGDLDSPIPDNLNVEDFRVAWTEFKEYRRETKKKMSGRAEKAMLTKLAKFTPSVAVAALTTSIENDWQGVFPEKVDIKEQEHDDDWYYKRPKKGYRQPRGSD